MAVGDGFITLEAAWLSAASPEARRAPRDSRSRNLSGGYATYQAFRTIGRTHKGPIAELAGQDVGLDNGCRGETSFISAR